VFFAAYITPRLSVPQKVAVGYFTCVVLGALGLWLEKKMPQFARILQAGSLALAYFVTYAAHFMESFRVIHSPALALTFLTLVVVAIVGVAQERQSATLAGMALFFGYYTSVASGVTGFTLASNAVLALAALFFLARNRWVHISYGAVLATYLTYMIWVWKLNRFGDLERLVFSSAYLGESDFRLRAGFLALYWLLFASGGLIVRRETLPAVERNGFLSLNNAFFFILFTLLMHHAHPELQWRFQFCFGGALLVSSAIAYGRFQPERLVMDTLFLQGLGVATLGLISYLKDVKLVAALALESAFVLVLAQAMKSRWVAWIGRATFAVAAAYAWGKYPRDWDAPMIWGVAFAAAVGLVCARLEKIPFAGAPFPARPGAGVAQSNEDLARKGAPTFGFSALYFAVLSTVLAMLAAGEHFANAQLPWAWIALAMAIALIGGALRTKEIFWASQLPLAWAHVSFYLAKNNDSAWPIDQSLALVAATFGFGAVVWRMARRRVLIDETAAITSPSSSPKTPNWFDDIGKERALATASRLLAPYVVLATLALIMTTVEYSPDNRLAARLAIETLALVGAGLLAEEASLVWIGQLPLAWAHATVYLAKNDGQRWMLDQSVALIGATLLVGLLLWRRERARPAPSGASQILWPYVVLALAMTVLTTFDHCPGQWRLAAFGAETLAFMIAGVVATEPPFVWAALAMLIVGVVGYFLRGRHLPELGGVGWANAVIGLLLFVLSERTLKWRGDKLRFTESERRALRAVITGFVTALAIVAVARLVDRSYLTVDWAVCGFLLLALGFWTKERSYRIGGLVTLGFSLARAVLHDLGRLEVVYRILSFIGLGVILLVLAFLYTKNRDKIAKWL